MFTVKRKQVTTILTIAVLLAFVCSTANAALHLEGQVQVVGAPLPNSTVTLWAANHDEPKQLAQAKSGSDGRFALVSQDDVSTDTVLYVIARSEDSSAVLLSMLGHTPPPKVMVNELTTVASAFTAARFIKGDAISGDPLGLRIAAGNTPNLADPVTGGWGKVVMDPINITQNTTFAKLNTLAALVSAYFTSGNHDWRDRFLKAAAADGESAPQDTVEALADIARASWGNPTALYALFDEAYPRPKDGSRRKAPFAPYLNYAPPDFALMLCFAGGGYYAGGKFYFDANGNLWSGQNWMPGSQSGVTDNIGGGTVKFASDGTALSPAVIGFRGMGVDSIGWGTGVTLDKVWVTGLNGTIGLFDFDGHPLAKESDFPLAGRVGGLQGVGVAANGDVWIADATKNQLLYFPGGRLQDGRLVNVKGLKSPFGIAIDAQNRVWVSNAQSITVLRFPADDPSKVETFRTGIGVRGVALDSKGNLWVASNMSFGFPPPVIPDGVSVMRQFQLAGEHVLKTLKPGETTGEVNLIRADGTQPAPRGFTGGKTIDMPWGVSIDGNDDVWVANFWGRGVVLMAGAEPKGHRSGLKAGDVIHQFTGGTFQMLTDVVVDPAGNVWAANNWNNPQAAILSRPPYPVSTWGGGSGFTVIYGVAAPTKAPLMGQVRPN